MFSFFKFLQSSLKTLKQKKGLWFTILGILSITGIFLSIYLLSHMTQNASKEVYESISSGYNKSFKNRLNDKNREFNRIISSILSNKTLVENVAANDLINVGESILSYNDNFSKTPLNTLKLSFYPVINQVNQYRNSINNSIASKNKTFGIEVLLDGVFIVYIQPIVVEDRIIGVLELKEELRTLKSEYTRENSIFLFMLESKMLNKLSIKSRTGKYREVIDEIYVEEQKYDGQFFAKIIENGKESYKELLDVGYSVDDQYFRSIRKVSDIDGNVIGVIVLGQTVADSGAFVNIVDRMTKTVTTVALGLVISILLFMF
ncbi:hypothetical protein [Poseidonibacter lekithochrous]|uniref:hypothetical protein n=1 Tax=Poseidonibacter lekithochrous TaxID=1904463 RepID=UPI0008FC41D5|nr:hypothetical protein [Poseidonibacter lekithochrous]QKJ22900.1 putative membrane protein [Poseidonibacter lekithochrous]